MSDPSPTAQPQTPPPAPTATDPTDPHQGAGEAYKPEVLAAAAASGATSTGTVPTLSSSDLAAILAAGGAGSTGLTKEQRAEAAQYNAMFQAYFRVWGEKPPKGYIDARIKDGLNVQELIAYELSKPTAQKTHFFRDGYANNAAFASQLLGRR